MLSSSEIYKFLRGYTNNPPDRDVNKTISIGDKLTLTLSVTKETTEFPVSKASLLLKYDKLPLKYALSSLTYLTIDVQPIISFLHSSELIELVSIFDSIDFSHIEFTRYKSTERLNPLNSTINNKHLIDFEVFLSRNGDSLLLAGKNLRFIESNYYIISNIYNKLDSIVANPIIQQEIGFIKYNDIKYYYVLECKHYVLVDIESSRIILPETNTDYIADLSKVMIDKQLYTALASKLSVV